MASYGPPMDLGIQPDWVDIGQNVTVDHNVVRDFLQLTADGASGIRNLWIHHNQVYDPQEFGVAVTFSGAANTIMEDILIEDNDIFFPGGAGIVVWPNFNGDQDLSALRIQVLRRVTIRRNKIMAMVKIYSGGGSAGQVSAGVGLGPFLTETRDIRIESNELTADSGQQSTSRQAIRMLLGDGNWGDRWKHQHGGALPIIDASGLNSGTGAITLLGHGLFNGAQVQLTPLTTTPLPAGIDPYHSYRLIKIDDNRFSLVHLSGAPVVFGPPPAGGTYKLMVSPLAENIVITNNTITGGWDWGVYSESQTKNLRVYDNAFCSRIELRNSHEDLYFFGNNCIGILYFPDTTLRNSWFYGNSWSAVDSTQSRFNGGAIGRFGPTVDPWRDIEATFESNRFTFLSEVEPRVVSALWMVPEAWAGTGAIHVRSNQFITPTTLNWDISPRFLEEFNESQTDDRAQVDCTVDGGNYDIHVLRGTTLPVVSRAFDQQGDLVQHWLEIQNPAGAWSWEGWLTTEPWAGGLVGNGFASLKTGTFTFTEAGVYRLRASAIDAPRAASDWGYSVSPWLVTVTVE